MDEVPESYVSNGRTYQLRQETAAEWAIREDREHHGMLTRTDKGWAAFAPGEDFGDDDRTPDWQTTLDSFLDYLR